MVILNYLSMYISIHHLVQNTLLSIFPMEEVKKKKNYIKSKSQVVKRGGAYMMYNMKYECG